MTSLVLSIVGFAVSLGGAVLSMWPTLTLDPEDAKVMRVWGPDGFLVLGREWAKDRKFARMAVFLIVAGASLQLIGAL